VLKLKQDIELELQSAHGVTMRNSNEQIDALAHFTAHMKAHLAKKPSVVEQLMPSFPPVCRRLTPGPGYLEALTAQNVDVISTPIREVVEDGVKREVDGIACATGFDTTFTSRYPIYGVNGVSLAERCNQSLKLTCRSPWMAFQTASRIWARIVPWEQGTCSY
jgi:cation diffusion facilitator CzcD-associated flavoprotein CzcO